MFSQMEKAQIKNHYNTSPRAPRSLQPVPCEAAAGGGRQSLICMESSSTCSLFSFFCSM